MVEKDLVKEPVDELVVISEEELLLNKINDLKLGLRKIRNEELRKLDKLNGVHAKDVRARYVNMLSNLDKGYIGLVESFVNNYVFEPLVEKVKILKEENLSLKEDKVVYDSLVSEEDFNAQKSLLEKEKEDDLLVKEEEVVKK